MMDQILKDIEERGWGQCQIPVLANNLKEWNRYFDESKENFIPAKVGSSSDRKREESIRGDFTSWIDTANPPVQFKEFLQFLEELKVELNRAFYMNLKEFECHLAYYPSGSFYKKHLDRFQNNSSRSLSFVCYLHEEWKESDGGELVIYNSMGEVLKEILPEPGTMVYFLSEEFPHEVKLSRRERRSLTGWMHTKIIS